MSTPDAKAHKRARLIILIVSTILGMVIGEALGGTAVLREANNAGYVLAQRQLASMRRDTSSVVLVDLSSTIEHRGGGKKVLPGSPEESELTKSFMAFEMVLKDIAAAKPSAIFIDWSLALTPEMRKPGAKLFAFHPNSQKGFREAYSQFFDTVAQIQSSIPIYIVGDTAESTRAEGGVVLPRAMRDFTLVSSWMEKGNYYPYVPFAPLQPMTGSRLPSFTSAIVSGLEWPDALQKNPKRFGIYAALSEVREEQHFWVDYGFTPSLLKSAVFAEPVDWAIDPDLAGRVQGRLVILADLTEPIGNDRFVLPLTEEQLTVVIKGERQTLPGSGGLAHACAVLTRTQEPLYALAHGWPERIVFGSLSILLAGLSAGVSALVCLLFTSEQQRERADYLVEIGLLMLVTVAIVWASPGVLAQFHLLLPQIESFLVMRALDLLGLALLIIYTMKRHGGS